MDYFENILAEELILLEVEQLATHTNIYWVLLEAENLLQRVGRLDGQLKTGNIDQKTASSQLMDILNNVNFGSWDVMNVKGQWQDLLKAHRAGKIDQATLEKRLKQIKRDAFLYNTVFAIGRALFGKLAGPAKQGLERAFKQEGMGWDEYNANKEMLNWQPTTSNLRRAQNVARQLVDLVGRRQALALLKNAA